MKYIIVCVCVMILNFNLHAQVEVENVAIDTAKNNIVAGILLDIIKQNNADINPLYLNADLRIKKILSDGMSYFPENQENVFTKDSASVHLIYSEIIKHYPGAEFAELSEMGKINRKGYLTNLLVFNGNVKSPHMLQPVYIETAQPIDGWDILDIIINNYWKNKYKGGKETIQSVLYIPNIYGYYNKSADRLIIKYYLSSYHIYVQGGKLMYRFIKRTSLNI